MRAVVQRVKKARVTVDKKIEGEIQGGLMVYLGVGSCDEAQDIEYMADKICSLRIFQDAQGKMNRSLMDINGQMLVISQFTLYGDCRKGRRPNFTQAGDPERAQEYYDIFINKVKDKGIKVECGKFQAYMEVESINDGPVTILVDSRKNF